MGDSLASPFPFGYFLVQGPVGGVETDGLKVGADYQGAVLLYFNYRSEIKRRRVFRLGEFHGIQGVFGEDTVGAPRNPVGVTLAYGVEQRPRYHRKFVAERKVKFLQAGYIGIAGEDMGQRWVGETAVGLGSQAGGILRGIRLEVVVESIDVVAHEGETARIFLGSEF